MQWMIANMWMALGAATVLGLLFGFSFRGLMVGAQVRKASVERELAKTELTQAKAEIDALYAAQRKRKEEAAEAVGGGEALQAELAEREGRITALGEELSAARDELELLKAEGSNGNDAIETLGAAAAGAVAGAVLSDDNEKELTELRDRNAWLEERVAALEADVSAQAEAPAILAAAPEESAETLSQEKLTWQTAYLRQRVAALETKLIEQPMSAAPILVPEPQPEPTPEPEPASVAEDPGTAAIDEELARLRWRNRYLEGRLAYFEEMPEGEEEVETEDPVADQVEHHEADASTPMLAATEEPADETVHPSEAMLAELEGVQPDQVDKPKDGGDDLTQITGIGPRIADVLNELGIWTYQQIAGWQPEHATWIENHLSFKGRVGRENWVGQASDLMATA